MNESVERLALVIPRSIGCAVAGRPPAWITRSFSSRNRNLSVCSSIRNSVSPTSSIRTHRIFSHPKPAAGLGTPRVSRDDLDVLPWRWLFLIVAVIVVPFPPGVVFEALTTAVAGRNIGAALLFVVGCVPVLTLLRLGLLATIVMLFAGGTAANFASADYTAWYATPGIAGLATLLVAAAVGFRFALGGRKVWERDLLAG
jgi:hypothetical protein